MKPFYERTPYRDEIDTVHYGLFEGLTYKWTKYKDINFRSRTEARFAQALDAENILWKYEPQRVRLSCGSYLPDFYLPELATWVEIKGWMDPYSANKIECFRKEYGRNLVVVMDSEV